MLVQIYVYSVLVVKVSPMYLVADSVMKVIRKGRVNSANAY